MILFPPPSPQGQVLLNENGTRVGNNPKILKYRDNNDTNNCGKSGKPWLSKNVQQS